MRQPLPTFFGRTHRSGSRPGSPPSPGRKPQEALRNGVRAEIAPSLPDDLRPPQSAAAIVLLTWTSRSTAVASLPLAIWGERASLRSL